jgi:dienelactone hydrolase
MHDVGRCLRGLAALAMFASPSIGAAADEIVAVPTSTDVEMQTRVLRPAGRGPFPLAIVSHGSPTSASQRADMEVPQFPAASDWLLARGYLVVLPLRRGYGNTGGAWAETYGPCANPDFYRAGLASAQDIEAALRVFRVRPDVARDRVLLVGWSAGGWGSIAAASENPPGVFAVINFAGGRGGGQPPQVGNCAPQRLVEAAGRYGATARIPSLWLYAANDKFFAPELSRKMFDAYVHAGGKAEYVALPAFHADGHRVFPDGRALWQQPVETFLATFKN